MYTIIVRIITIKGRNPLYSIFTLFRLTIKPTSKMATVIKNQPAFLMSMSAMIAQGQVQTTAGKKDWHWLANDVTLNIVVPTPSGSYIETQLNIPKQRPHNIVKCLEQFNNALQLPTDKTRWKERVINFTFVAFYSPSDVIMVDGTKTPNENGEYPALINKTTGEEYLAPKSGISFGDIQTGSIYGRDFRLFGNFFKETIIAEAESDNLIEELNDLIASRNPLVKV